MESRNKEGKIIQVMGPVVDVQFPDRKSLPYIRDALSVDNNGTKGVMEVSQHIGDGVVRCIMLTESEGLHKDMPVKDNGGPIQVPVGKRTLGRLFNVFGDTIDHGEDISEGEQWVIHREPPRF